MIFDGLDGFLNEYVNSIRELEDFIDSYSFLKNNNDDQIKRSAISNFKFYSNSIIVTLYGDFERTIKRMAEEFIKRKFAVCNNNIEMLSHLSILNVKNSLRCIDNPKLYRKEAADVEILKNELTLSLNSNAVFEVKNDLLLNNIMNAVSDQISDFANNYLEIQNYNNRIKKKRFILEYLVNVYSISEQEAVQRINNERNFFIDIDTVVKSRHNIAHLGTQTILNNINEIKDKYAKFFLAYIKSYHELLIEELLLCCKRNNYRFLTECAPRETDFTARKILTFDCPVSRIIPNEVLIIVKPNGNVDYNIVINLMSEDENVQEARQGDPIGIKFLNNIKKDDKIYFFNE